MLVIRRITKSDEKQESIQCERQRFRLAGAETSRIIGMRLYPDPSVPVNHN